MEGSSQETRSDAASEKGPQNFSRLVRGSDWTVALPPQTWGCTLTKFLLCIYVMFIQGSPPVATTQFLLAVFVCFVLFFFFQTVKSVLFYSARLPQPNYESQRVPSCVAVCYDSRHASVCVCLPASVFWIIALALCVFGSARLPFWICFFGHLHCLPRHDPSLHLFIPVSRCGFSAV